MKLGTKSLLFGVHQFVLHPLCLAIAWTRLYGFPWDPRLWVAFIVHDWGYWGSPNMDGFEGKLHPEVGGLIMDRLFGKEWGDFTRFHSKSYATWLGRQPSKLYKADKHATTLLPEWLYLFLANLTGEIHEYMRPYNCVLLAVKTGMPTSTQREWLRALKAYHQ